MTKVTISGEFCLFTLEKIMGCGTYLGKQDLVLDNRLKQDFQNYEIKRLTDDIL